jgi:hypothetical protein
MRSPSHITLILPFRMSNRVRFLTCLLVSERSGTMSVELGVPFEDLGTVKLKGFEKCVRVFSIRWAQRGSSGSADSA